MRVVADPDRQIPALSQTLVVFGPVGYPLLLPQNFDTAISAELVRHL
jgi:hypothetical protein